MNNKEAKLEQFRLLEPINYPLVESLRLNQNLSEDNQSHDLTVTISLRSRSELNRRRLALSFSGVRAFKINPENLEISFSLLSIVSVDGWENIGFKVFNGEQDIDFSFFCDDFTASLEDPD